MEVAGLDEEMAQLFDRVVNPERALQVERPASTVAERHRARHVDGAVVEGGAQDEPPVEDVGDGTGGLVESAARPPARGRPLVVYEIVELARCQANVCPAVVHSTPDLNPRAGPLKRPRLAGRLQRQRNQRQQTCARQHGGGTGVEQLGKLAPEKVLRIDRRLRSVGPRAQIYRHCLPGSGVRRRFRSTRRPSTAIVRVDMARPQWCQSARATS